MIKLTIDEAAAYDILSIMAIKAGVDKTLLWQLVRIADEIVEQVTFEKHEAIVTSPEYLTLRAANQRVFDLIDGIKTRGEQLGDAKAIDDANYARFLAKKALQAKWFDNPLTERKLGYEVDTAASPVTIP